MILMRQLHDSLPKTIRLAYLKIKSHQSTNEQQPHEVLLNTAADDLANKIRANFIGPIQTYQEEEGLLLHDFQGVKVQHLK